MQDIPLSVNDTYYKVTPQFANRLDLIAFEFYGNSYLWWAIALASDVTNPLDVPEGSILRIPPLSTLYFIKGGGMN